jgi:RNA polymerase sigma-70 factor, ECF subfamily
MNRHEPSTTENHMNRTDDARSASFERFYHARFPEIAGFVRRRADWADADDILAQIFSVAWRRFERIPEPPHDRLWLFVVARKSLAEHGRAQRRRHRLGFRLAQEAATAWPGGCRADNPFSESVLNAMSKLKPAEIEALQLVLWDQLTHPEAAAVLGCSTNAFEIRYRRARNAVRDQLAPDGPVRAGSGPASFSSTPVRENAS